jgi:hypothetical protein
MIAATPLATVGLILLLEGHLPEGGVPDYGLFAYVLLIPVVGMIGVVLWVAWLVISAAYRLVRHALGYGPALRQEDIYSHAYGGLFIFGLYIATPVIISLMNDGVLPNPLMKPETMWLLILGGSIALAGRVFWRWLTRSRS